MSKKYTIEELKELTKNKNFTIIDEKYISMRNGILAIDNNGYKVIVKRNHIFKNESPEIFHKNNPYTIGNIKQYIINNKINAELLSTEYINNTSELLWKCSCTKEFTCSWNKFSQGKHLCNECSLIYKGLNHRITKDRIINSLENVGLKLLNELFSQCVSSAKIDAIDIFGYKYNFLWSVFKNGKFPEKFHPSNKYTIENINTYLKINRDGEYICISDDYKNNTQQLKFKHIKCECIFEASLAEMKGKYVGDTKYKYYKTCPNCYKKKIESTHASVLKQVFKHEYPDTTLEDKSCINEKTKRSLPTDIVNHNLKIAIEIQSQYHDSISKKDIDKYKKDFWINKGYQFYDPDIRDYSILELIQLFFPNIDKIPNYIDYNFSNCIDHVKVQNLLNDGHSIKEIGEIMNAKDGTIRALLNAKKVFLPDNYKKLILNQKPIVRLTKNGDFIKRYENLSRIKEDNFATGTVIRVLKKIQNFSYNSYWVYEEDYINDTYLIPIEKEDHYMLSVDKYSIDNIFIKSYPTIYDAENDSRSSRSEIYRVASGNRKSSRNEKWKFKI